MLRSIVKWIARRCGVGLFPYELLWQGKPACSVTMDLSSAERALLRRVEPFTMTSLERVMTLVRAVRHVSRYKIAGDIVECGVWRGGSMMAAALTLLAMGDQSRRLFLFDTFEGLPPPTERDRDCSGVSAQRQYEVIPNWCYASLEEVRENLESTGYPMDRVHFIKGKVEETIPYASLGQLCILRLDTDWYESTRHELQHLYPLLVGNGFLIIDDYGHWQGARQAVDEFIAAHPDQPLYLHPIDYTGRVAVKPS